MGNSFTEGTGFKVEAVEDGPMLYSADAVKLAEDLKDWFGRQLKRAAIDLAKQEGRRTVAYDDVERVFKNVKTPFDGPDFDEESDDGG